MNEIVTTTNENNVPVDVDYAIEEWRAYQRLTRELLDETDYQTHRGRKYKTKSAWQKYARAFNINTQIIDKDIVKNDKGVVSTQCVQPCPTDALSNQTEAATGESPAKGR